MPKIVEYPRASLQRSLALAEAVDKMGGEASDEMAAESMGNRLSGAFKAVIASAVKFGLISSSKGRLKTESLFQDYKLAYSEAQKLEAMRRAFLSAPLFAAIVTRLRGQTIPAHFEKLLIREHNVPADIASRVAGYFMDGARETGILAPNGVIAGSDNVSDSDSDSSVGSESAESERPSENGVSVPFFRGYTVRITGPGLDTRIGIKEEEDIDIVEVMLKKVRRLLKAEQGGAEDTR